MSQDVRKVLNQREDLRNAKRIVVKVGSAVITNTESGNLATSRMTSIIEQIVELQRSDDRKLLLVTSGAVAFGHKKIGDVIRRSMSLRDMDDDSAAMRSISPTGGFGGPRDQGSNARKYRPAKNRTAAACGQLSLVSFYETMFHYQGVDVAQLLVTKDNLLNVESRKKLLRTIEDLLDYNIVPIINTNDAVEDRVAVPAKSGDRHPSATSSLEMTSANMKAIVFEDNDALASLLASELNSDLLILLTNVDGIYTEPPSSATARFLTTYHVGGDEESTPANPVLKFGSKSSVGAGGMESKIRSAMWAVERGTTVVVCNGNEPHILTRLVSGENVGTFFVGNHQETELASPDHCSLTRTQQQQDTTREEIEAMVNEARRAGQLLASSLKGKQRREIIERLAAALEEPNNVTTILAANKEDLDEAQASQLAAPLVSRLKLSEAKLKTLASGLRHIGASSCDLLDVVTKKTLISDDGLMLTKVTCPIGVLLVIFESRPDCLPQLAALAIATGNALLAKGGKEATRSNRAIMSLINDCLIADNNLALGAACRLLTTREQVNALLNACVSHSPGTSLAGQQQARHLVDLIIPRGSNQLVRSIQQQAAGVGVPVLGHSEGICHVYVDESAKIEQTVKIVLDAKCNYPAACNALETLLVHSSHVLNAIADLQSSLFCELWRKLCEHNVVINVGPRLHQMLDAIHSSEFKAPLMASMRTEYSSLELTIEMVDSVEQAIDHINAFGSGHTDTIVTNHRGSADLFLARIDSSSVFWNASTRFADGYRYGLGAEVGISTGKIHARGPVGADGLLSHKWLLVPDDTLKQTKPGHDAYAVGELDTRGYLHQHII
ncbi:Delta-1-pyrroline-5-carboxylate synthase, partial [Fragariocoptes setiger]